VVNSRQTKIFIFDRTRSLSLDVHESCNLKPKKRNLNLSKNASILEMFAYFAIFRLLTYFRKNDEFSPISFSNLLAERIFYQQKQPVKFIPLWKIVKIAFLIILNYLLCSKLVLLSGIFYFYSPPRTQNCKL